MQRVKKLNTVTFIVPKSRKPKFDLTLRIIDLNNVPLNSGIAYVKWQVPNVSGAEHLGHSEKKTPKTKIEDHKAIWDYTKEISVRMTIDKVQHLQECPIEFSVVQEYAVNTRDGTRDSRNALGTVKLNLAEYTQTADAVGQPADDKEDSEDGMITRRYLMQDSKVNATLKIGIRLKQVEGDANFVPPPLKSAMVIGGIAGIMNAEAGESEDMPTLTAKTREISEAQDIYRRNLAATWTCYQGELPPDRLVEDLFAGGDGGKMEPPPPYRRHGHGHKHGMNRGSVDVSTSDSDSRRTVKPDLLSPEEAKPGHRRNSSGNGHRYSNSQNSMSSTISGRGSIEQQMQHSHTARRKTHSEPQDLTEFDLRDDLRSWQVRVN